MPGTVLDHIGRTPMVTLTKIASGLPVPMLVKCEHLNPGGQREGSHRARDRRRLMREEGLLVGGSSGTAVGAALRVAASGRVNGPVVALHPDSWDR